MQSSPASGIGLQTLQRVQLEQHPTPFGERRDWNLCRARRSPIDVALFSGRTSENYPDSCNAQMLHPALRVIGRDALPVKPQTDHA
jgi:hypothetical protein